MANPLQQIIAQQRERRKQEGGEEVVSLIKSFFNHASLYAGLVAYTAVGAGVSFFIIYHNNIYNCDNTLSLFFSCGYNVLFVHILCTCVCANSNGIIS